MNSNLPKPSNYNAAIRFAIGIPIWIGVTFLLDGLGKKMEGLTGAVPSRSIATWPSYCVLSYFAFSFLSAVTTTTRKWRLRLGCLTHLFLLASIIAGVFPMLGRRRSGDIADGVFTLVFVYFVFFVPWIITWVKFILKGNSNTMKPIGQ